jgi:hypothetical protein
MTLGNMRELGVHHLIAFCVTIAGVSQATCPNLGQPMKVHDVVEFLGTARRFVPASGDYATSSINVMVKNMGP